MKKQADYIKRIEIKRQGASDRRTQGKATCSQGNRNKNSMYSKG